jgi:hypothetical protein
MDTLVRARDALNLMAAGLSDPIAVRLVISQRAVDTPGERLQRTAVQRRRRCPVGCSAVLAFLEQ